MYYYPLLGKWLDDSNSRHTPLTVENIEKEGFDATSPNCDEAFLDKHLSEKEFAFGGYLEKRNLYERSPLFSSGSTFRNIHLGTDIWGAVDCKLFAPFDLKLHSFNDNANFGDYGPTVIFEGNDDYPYILMGHLAKKDLQLWHKKRYFKQGECVGHFGTASENGGWYPHVHLQVMSDMQGRKGDFPGVYAESELHEVKDILRNPQGLFWHAARENP